jgi:uncharacterized membrane protein YkgB
MKAFRIHKIKGMLLGQFSAYLLLAVWTYSGLEKLIAWERSWSAFHNQVFPADLAALLSYAVPGTELALAVLLVIPFTRWWGLMGSILVLAVFTSYVGLVWWGAFPRVPCNCAGFLARMGWGAHLLMNMVLLCLGLYALWRGNQDLRTRAVINP